MRHVLTVLFLGPLIHSAAQVAVPRAALDTSVIRIGEQVTLHLSIDHRVDEGIPAVVQWPSIPDTLTEHIEVLSSGRLDTMLVLPDEDPYLIRQYRDLVITSWDTGYWAIPPFPFTVNGDTLESAPILIEVRTVEVDTSVAFRDIKEIEELPFSWGYWFRQNWPYLAAGLATLAAFLFLFFRLRARKAGSDVVAPVAQVDTRDLRQRTLDALRSLEEKQLWQKGEVKSYHSELTEILRNYVEERFDVPALERTTDELLAALRPSSMGREHQEKLANLLRLADLVKFAKYLPVASENEGMMEQALRFVMDTSPEPTAHEEQR
ncbi:MAG: hypothetical protein KDB88_13760 [Flavobacteriales bacterium]|nr:hypothetical protein [Flavobacteriales bacterium]